MSASGSVSDFPDSPPPPYSPPEQPLPQPQSQPQLQPMPIQYSLVAAPPSVYAGQPLTVPNPAVLNVQMPLNALNAIASLGLPAFPCSPLYSVSTPMGPIITCSPSNSPPPSNWPNLIQLTSGSNIRDIPDRWRELELKVTEQSDGYITHDPQLEHNPILLRSLIDSYQVSPALLIEIIGSHESTTSSTDSEGNTTTSSSTTTDFQYTIDASPYVSTASLVREPQCSDAVKGFIESTKHLKELKLIQVVHWDVEWLQKTITARIRQLGYRDDVTIRFMLKKNRFVIHAHNSLANCCFSKTTDCLAWLTCMCLPFYCVRACMKSGSEWTLFREYGMTISAQDWFAYNMHFIRIQ